MERNEFLSAKARRPEKGKSFEEKYLSFCVTDGFRVDLDLEQQQLILTIEANFFYPPGRLNNKSMATVIFAKSKFFIRFFRNQRQNFSFTEKQFI